MRQSVPGPLPPPPADCSPGGWSPLILWGLQWLPERGASEAQPHRRPGGPAMQDTLSPGKQPRPGGGHREVPTRYLSPCANRPHGRAAAFAYGGRKPLQDLKEPPVPRRRWRSPGQGVTAPNSPGALGIPPAGAGWSPRRRAGHQGNWLVGGKRSRPVPHYRLACDGILACVQLG